MTVSTVTNTPPQLKVKKVIKRDGTSTEFNPEKITESIFKAAQSISGKDRNLAASLAAQVVERLNKEFTAENASTTEKIQEMVERTLIEQGHIKTAKAYILYQHTQHTQQPKLPSENMLFSNQAMRVLERRYLLKDGDGNLIETPLNMLKRVAKNVAQADKLYGAKSKEIAETEEQFFKVMAELCFLPNSPTLMNAGTKTQQLSSCFVLPIDDTMESIFGSLRDAALIHQRGSGTGFSFSRLRPKADPVERNLGVASGPVAFLGAYDAALDVIKQGGVRPGANMAVLHVDHPDVIQFIESKRDKKSLKNFNISVAVTDNFMRAVEEDREYNLTNPKTGKYVGRLRARDVFSLITQNAWKTGDPGLLFIDEINRRHPAKHLGKIETTNQCGEAPLLPYEGCVLGSINLNKCTDEEKKEVDWNKLRQTVHTAVHFLDNVIDMNSYPKLEIEKQTKNTRKFGLGIMGFADTLIRLGIKYDSKEGLEFADKVMSFIKQSAYQKSMELAIERGVSLAWRGSDHHKAGRKMRNTTCLSISPTGTISILADASPGCEPLYAITYQKMVLGDTEFIYINKHFEEIAKKKGFYSEDLMRKIAHTGSIQLFKEISKDVRDIFVTAQDISPEWHIKMQATLQRHVDNSISKTINIPQTASIKDVENTYMLAWKAKCKGITIYRDGSYEGQVMTFGE